VPSIGHNPASGTGVHGTARIAPNTVVCGDVTIGENCSIGSGAVLTATVFGVERPPEGESLMADVMARYAKALVRWHAQDRETE
jgi:serine acetyltransferase